MKKLFSQIQGKPVFSRDTRAPVARAFDLILNPSNATLVALSVHPSAAQVVGMRDILSWYPEIVIRDTDSIVPPEEVLRIKEVLDQNYAPLMQNTVVTESGKVLGRVYDYLFDLDAGIMVKFMVAKTFLGLINFGERIFSARDIIRIEPTQIIVKDDMSVIEAQPEMIGA